MKICYINNYGESTGWSEAGRGYIRAMQHVGLDVCLLPIRYNTYTWNCPEDLKEAENKDKTNCDIIIQHVLPQYMEPIYGYKNVALFASETDSLPKKWIEHLKRMDEIWCINFFQREVCQKYLDNIPIHIIPHAIDVTKFSKNHEKLPIPLLDNKFVFYYIGEAVRRKNLAALLKAFHLEFLPSEQVELVIKASYPGCSKEQSEQQLVEFCKEIRNSLRLYGNIHWYKSEVIISQYLSEEQLMSLHASCHCKVNPSRGEAFSLSCIDALGMGNPVIASYWGGPLQYLRSDTPLLSMKEGVDKGIINSFLCEYSLEPCFGMIDQMEGLHTGYEKWAEISISSLREQMRNAFNFYKQGHFSKMKDNCKKTADNYSYNTIGNLIKGILNG